MSSSTTALCRGVVRAGTVIALTGVALSAAGQDPRGSITGRITDASGGRLPGQP